VGKIVSGIFFVVRYFSSSNPFGSVLFNHSPRTIHHSQLTKSCIIRTWTADEDERDMETITAPCENAYQQLQLFTSKVFTSLDHPQLWVNLRTLVGRELKSLERGKPFVVQGVQGDRVLLSPVVSGKQRIIQRKTLERAFSALLDRRELTGLEIAEEFSPFNAGYVAALLAALPDVAVCVKPIRLIFMGQQLFYLE
jgi:hypothetical protein